MGFWKKGGGHAMAAGVTLRKSALAPLRAFLEFALAADVESARRANGLSIDGAISAGAANAGLVAMIERAGPFGSGNPEPAIRVARAYPCLYRGSRTVAYPLAIQSADGAGVNAIAFRAVGQKLGAAPVAKGRRPAHAAGSTPALDPGRASNARNSGSPIAAAKPFAGR